MNNCCKAAELPDIYKIINNNDANGSSKRNWREMLIFKSHRVDGDADSPPDTSIHSARSFDYWSLSIKLLTVDYPTIKATCRVTWSQTNDRSIKINVKKISFLIVSIPVDSLETVIPAIACKQMTICRCSLMSTHAKPFKSPSTCGISIKWCDQASHYNISIRNNSL